MPAPILARTTPLPSVPLNAKEEQSVQGLSITEKTLIVQAVYETGTSDFKAAAKLLQGHPLLQHRTKYFFNAEKIATVHTALTKELGLPTDTPLPQHAPQLLQVARKWYLERVYELRAVMQEEVDSFRKTFKELEMLKAGEVDWQLTDPDRGAREHQQETSSADLATTTIPAQEPPIAITEPVVGSESKGKKKRKASPAPASTSGLEAIPTPVETSTTTHEGPSTSTPAATPAPTAPTSIAPVDVLTIDPLGGLDIEAGVAAAVAAALGTSGLGISAAAEATSSGERDGDVSMEG